MGIMLGLFIGKPLGVFTISWLSVKLGVAQLPPGVNFKQIFAVSILCGIGFTMSMFIASLAFEHGGLDYGSYSRLGILVGSTLAAVVVIWPCDWLFPSVTGIRVRRDYEKTGMAGSNVAKPAGMGGRV